LSRRRLKQVERRKKDVVIGRGRGVQKMMGGRGTEYEREGNKDLLGGKQREIRRGLEGVVGVRGASVGRKSRISEMIKGVGEKG